MQKYLKILVEDIHSTTVATIGADGHPKTRVIDIMLYDEKGVYFLTAKGKVFYEQLMEQQYIAISATKDKMAISLRGKIKNIGYEKLDAIFEKTNICKKYIQMIQEVHYKYFVYTKQRVNILILAILLILLERVLLLEKRKFIKLVILLEKTV